MGRRTTNAPLVYRSALFHVCSLGPVLLILALSLLHLSVIERLQDQVFDLYQRLSPRAYDPAVPVRIVDIDDASIAKFGQWPWPRTRIADLIDRLHKANAAAIAFDIVFSEPDRTSPDAFIAALDGEARRTAVRAALGDTQSNDVILAHSVGAAPVVLGTILTQTGELPSFEAPYGIASAGDDPDRFVARFSGAVLPLAVLRDKASGLGALNWLPDGDQIVRRVPLLLAAGVHLVPSLAMESLRVAQGASTYVVRASNASGDVDVHAGLQSVKVGAFAVGSDPRGDVQLRFSAHHSERFVPAWKVLDGSVGRAEVDGRIMIVGSSSAGLGDIRATPLDPAMPGVEVQAQAVEGLLLHDRLLRPDWSVLEPFVGLLAVLALIIILPLAPAMVGATAATASVGAIVATSWLAFSLRHLLIDPVVPSAMILVAYLGGLSALFRAEQRDRRFVQDAFGRFVSPDVVAQLARNPGQLTLGGEQRELTVMFTDVRNFSAIAERMSAQDLTHFMNNYLSPMSEIVLAYGGTVDKYVGDAIMAFWNAPLADAEHADHAARAALAMVAALPRLRSDLMAADPSFPPLRCGIGLASGPCVVGNLGSRLRFDYSALGDDVNVASRLEGLTKIYGLDILATEATRQLAPSLAWLTVDTVVVVGREAPTQIVTLLGDATVAQSASFKELDAAHNAMLEVYRTGPSDAAIAAIRLIRTAAPITLSQMYDVYLERCQADEAESPEQRAVMRLTHK